MAGNIADLLVLHQGAPARVLYRHCVDGAWRDVRAGEFARDVARWQAAFRRAGLAGGDRIVLAARNGVAWVAADLAALGLRLVVVPLHVDDAGANLGWCAAHVEPRLAIVENLRLAAALRAAPALRALPLVVLHGDDAATGDLGATPVARFLPVVGGAVAAVEAAACASATLATICFTAGTAGRPKGVMLSHGNLLANVASCRQTGMARADDRFLSLLPLSHMFERTGGCYLPLALGATVVFARGIAQAGEDLARQAPTAIFAVPRILERLAAQIDRALAAAPVRKALFDACVAAGLRVAEGRARPTDRLVQPLLDRLVARPLRARLGGRLRLAVVGGAPLDPALARRFIGLGLTVLQGYGMTEAAPVIAVNRADDNHPETVGPPVPGVDVRLGAGDELLVRGANVMLGYWRDEAATRAALVDGWLHTGDVASLEAGRIRIRGRIKDILVLSSGEKLPPHDAERAIERDPVFARATLVGEGQPFLTLVAVVGANGAGLDEAALTRRANAQLEAFPHWVRVRRVVVAAGPGNVDRDLAGRGKCS